MGLKLNGAIHITSTILKLEAASTAEAEQGAVFLNNKKLKYCGSSLQNSAIHNHQLQYTLTTQQQLELSTTQSNDKDHEQ
jgi:hypothetical protein